MTGPSPATLPFAERDAAIYRATLRYLNSPHDLISPPQDIILPVDETRFEFCDDAEEPRAVAAVLRPIEQITWERNRRIQFVTNFIAWAANEPGSWWRWDPSRDHVLGLDVITIAHHSKQPCQLVATPEEWAALVGEAICVLDWESVDVRLFEGLTLRTSEELRRSYERRRRQQWKGRRPVFER